jgi:hypothetical protein
MADWKVLGKTRAGNIEIGPEGCAPMDAPVVVTHRPGADATAALVAAAPALLEACRKALEVYSDITSEKFAKGGDKEALAALRAAVKEAGV